ncbi:MAG TPA: CHRD domain-containing protein [Paucimonas sp.]|nr:CHRD domain-containing protein [Paucimonas sp.]
MKPGRHNIRPRWPAALLLALLASCGGGDGGGMPSSGGNGEVTPSSAITTLNATLSGAQETPPNTSAATGNASLNVDTAAKTFSVSVATTGVAATMAHIHDGAPGVAGPIVFPLTENPPGSGNWSASAALSDAQLNALLAGNYYVNVHSAAFPNGEIRGQLTTGGTGSGGNSSGGGAGGTGSGAGSGGGSSGGNGGGIGY